MKYKITVVNGSGVLVDTNIIEAINEVEALREYLKRNIIFDGDTIRVEEV